MDDAQDSRKARIRLKSFSFLQSRMLEMGFSPDCELEITPGMTPEELIRQLGLVFSEVEGVFVNGCVRDWNVQLQAGDRVALVPPGTPGPYRYMLGIKR